jgi:hypothetical protein
MVETPIREQAATSACAAVTGRYIYLNLRQPQGSAQILPNIPLTILQLSFDGVKGNLKFATRNACANKSEIDAAQHKHDGRGDPK